jgi:hypothetical protein
MDKLRSNANLRKPKERSGSLPHNIFIGSVTQIKRIKSQKNPINNTRLGVVRSGKSHIIQS